VGWQRPIDYLEIEAQYQGGFPLRMYRYHSAIFLRYNREEPLKHSVTCSIGNWNGHQTLPIYLAKQLWQSRNTIKPSEKAACLTETAEVDYPRDSPLNDINKPAIPGDR
jgi:hypothetical protein